MLGMTRSVPCSQRSFRFFQQFVPVARNGELLEKSNLIEIKIMADKNEIKKVENVEKKINVRNLGNYDKTPIWDKFHKKKSTFTHQISVNDMIILS